MRITKINADLQVVIKSGDETVREVVSSGYSIAPITISLFAAKDTAFQIVLSVPAKTSNVAHYSLVTDSARQANDLDKQEWEAESTLFAPLRRPPSQAVEDPETRLRSAADFFGMTGDLYNQASSLRLLGYYYRGRQNFTAARDAYTRASAILRSSPWRFEESVVRQNLADAMAELGEDRGAITEFDAVLGIRAELSDDLGRGITWFGRARSYWHVGELQKALDDYRLALAVFRKLNENRWEATVQNAMGLLNAELGRVESARANYGEASSIWQRLHDRSGLMMTSSNVGLLKETLGSHEEARAAFQEGIKLCQELGNRQAQAYIIQNLGDVSANEGNHSRALKDYQESLDIKLQLKDVRAGAETKRKMGLSYLALGQLDRAKSALDEALSESRAVSDRKGEAQSLGALARLESASGSQRMAEDRIAQAVHLIESTRMELRTRDLRTSYFSTQRDFYDFAIDLAMEKGGSGALRGLEWSERQRARTLLDSLGQTGASPDNPFASIVDAVRMRRELLDRDTILVEYSSGPTRTYAWLISATEVRSVRLAGWNTIAPVIERLSEAIDSLHNRTKRGAMDAALKEVAGLIWWPLGIGAKTARVVIASDAGLERVPFAALPISDGGPRLIERSEIVSVPSASLAVAIRLNQATYPRRIAIFADAVFSGADLRLDRTNRSSAEGDELPRLRFSREESTSIAQQAGASSASEMIDFAANVESLRRSFADPGTILHLATHAIVDNRDPAASRLVLSRVDRSGKPETGELRLSDIYNLRIRRELIVLSACHAAAGPEVKGEGVISLARAFLYAGAKGVVASSWKIEDRSSAEFMRRFYEVLLRQGRTPAEALRTAQLSMMRDPRWSGVENWAAFLFVGDWRITPWGK